MGASVGIMVVVVVVVMAVGGVGTNSVTSSIGGGGGGELSMTLLYGACGLKGLEVVVVGVTGGEETLDRKCVG